MSLLKLDSSEDENIYLKVSTCIDYLEFVIIGKEFDKDDMQWRLLCNILNINPLEHDDKIKHNELFSDVYLYDANIYVHTHFRKVQEGEEPRWKVQMAGQACREFEERGGNWVALLQFIKDQRHSFTRIDLACDDFHYLDLEELKEYIHKKWYISNFRKTCLEEYIPNDQLLYIDDSIPIDNVKYPEIKSKEQREGLSYSATWGTSQTCQLQIYDKMQERRHKGYDVVGDHWIRFEMRFRKEVAEICCNYVLEGLKNGYFSKLCGRLLYGYMDFKEGYIYSSKPNFYKLPTCKKYQDFLGNISKEDKLKISKPTQQVDVERIMARKKKWIANSVAKSFLMLFLENPEMFNQDIQDMMAEKVKEGKLQNSDIAIVNYGRMQKRLPIFTQKEYLDFIEDNLGVRPDNEDNSKDDYFFEDDLPF